MKTDLIKNTFDLLIENKYSRGLKATKNMIFDYFRIFYFFCIIIKFIMLWAMPPNTSFRFEPKAMKFKPPPTFVESHVNSNKNHAAALEFFLNFRASGSCAGP